MLKCKFCTCAESVIRDAETNNFSVINIVDELSPVNFPSILPRLCILNMFDRDSLEEDERYTARLIISMDEETLFDQNVEIDFQKKFRTRNVIVFNGFPLPKPGILKVAYHFEGKIISDWNIIINSPKVSIKQTKVA